MCQIHRFHPYSQTSPKIHLQVNWGDQDFAVFNSLYMGQVPGRTPYPPPGGDPPLSLWWWGGEPDTPWDVGVVGQELRKEFLIDFNHE